MRESIAQDCESKPKVLVSACLLGSNCRYDGKSKPNAAVKRLSERFELIPVCPETLGGLQIPRTPSERNMLEGGDKVLSRDGEDRTEAFRLGARKMLDIALANECKLAVLKGRSPSCGTDWVYDGTFSGSLVPGDGVGAALLKANGIKVVSEDNLNELP